MAKNESSVGGALGAPLLLRLPTVPPRLSGRSRPRRDVRAPSLELGEDFIAELQSLEDEEKTHCTDCASTCLSNKLRMRTSAWSPKSRPLPPAAAATFMTSGAVG